MCTIVEVFTLWKLENINECSLSHTRDPDAKHVPPIHYCLELRMGEIQLASYFAL